MLKILFGFCMHQWRIQPQAKVTKPGCTTTTNADINRRHEHIHMSTGEANNFPLLHVSVYKYICIDIIYTYTHAWGGKWFCLPVHDQHSDEYYTCSFCLKFTEEELLYANSMPLMLEELKTLKKLILRRSRIYTSKNSIIFIFRWNEYRYFYNFYFIFFSSLLLINAF